MPLPLAPSRSSTAAQASAVADHGLTLHLLALRACIALAERSAIDVANTPTIGCHDFGFGNGDGIRVRVEVGR